MQRWLILIALTLARISMGVQFQSVAALSPRLTSEAGLGFAAIGTLMGIYLLPGAVAALFGGWAGQKIGDIRTALFGLALMALGGIAGALLAGFEAQLAARLVAGIGAVALNVMLTKMAGDWFQGRSDLPVAMGVLSSSWPAGLAVAMLVLPWLGGAYALQTLLMLPAALCAVTFVLLAVVWRSPFSGAQANGPSPGILGAELGLVAFSGLIWGLYNVAFIGIISWSAGRHEANGADAISAAATGSLIGWAAILSVAAGGWLARSLRRPDGAALGCFAVSAVAATVFALGGPVTSSTVFLLALGIIIGPAAAMIMTLPVEATRAETRAMGMGVHWAMYYVLMGIGPGLMGVLREITGSPTAPLLVSAGLMTLCLLLWPVFRWLQARLASQRV